MSVERASRTNARWPAIDLRFNTRLRLPRLTALKAGLSLPTAPTVRRVDSPAGDSTLITSAPRSASMTEQKGPATNCVTSRTRRPSRARGGMEIVNCEFVPDGGVLVYQQPGDLRNARTRGDADLQSPRGTERDDLGDVSGARR